MSRDTADVVIVGAGIMGLSIAHQISRRDPRRIVILEKALNVGEGSTGASCAILRQRYTHPEAVMVARDGLHAHRNWSRYTGVSEPRARFHHTGVLWMMAETPAAIESARAMMSGLGIDIEVLSAPEVRERFPALSTCNRPFDLTGETEHDCADHESFLFETESGFFDPVSATQDLLEAVRAAGVDVRLRTKVTGIGTQGRSGHRGRSRRRHGYRRSRGHQRRRTMGTAGRSPLAGFDYKTHGWTIHPIRRKSSIGSGHAMSFLGHCPWSPTHPGGIYFRPEAGGQQILIGSIREEDEQEVVADPDVFNGNIDAAFRDVKIHALHHRIPSLPYRGHIAGVSGMYDLNVEDVHPVIGPTPLEGFIVVNGFSGHGFKESPSVGSMGPATSLASPPTSGTPKHPWNSSALRDAHCLNGEGSVGLIVAGAHFFQARVGGPSPNPPPSMGPPAPCRPSLRGM